MRSKRARIEACFWKFAERRDTPPEVCIGWISVYGLETYQSTQTPEYFAINVDANGDHFRICLLFRELFPGHGTYGNKDGGSHV